MKSFVVVLVAAVCLLLAAPSFAQMSQQPQQQPAAQQQQPSGELYHVHVVRAAPGKLGELLEAYKSGPAPAKDDPQVAPLVFRHREGHEWDLMVITPLGKEETLSAAPPPKEVQDFLARVVPLVAWHGDTFAVGPAWEQVSKAMLPEKGQGIYIISDYRAAAGQRPQMVKTLQAIGQQTPGRNVLFFHIEGAPWNVLSVTRYDSWADLGGVGGQAAGQQDMGLELRKSMALHHDTIATLEAGGK